MPASITRSTTREETTYMTNTGCSDTDVPLHLGGHAGVTHLDEAVLNFLVARFDIRRMIDIGCGPGGMVKLANKMGLSAVGVDGDPRIPELSGLPSHRLILHDFTQGELLSDERYDLAWSVEFLEHVEERFQKNYMKLFQRARYVLCTAAPAGKPGHNHVNCRDEAYWKNTFSKYGFRLDEDITRALREITSMKREFVRETGMFFIREEQKPLEFKQGETINELRLEFGCGEAQPKEGYVGVDIRPFPGVRYICNAWEIIDYVGPSSVTSIYSRHFFEHLTFPQADMTLNAWSAILKPGGKLQIIVPDIMYHIRQFLSPDGQAPSATNPKWTLRQHALAGFWGWQREGDTKNWDVHKSGYDYALIEEKLKRHGFQEIIRLNDQPWNLNIACRNGVKFRPNRGTRKMLSVSQEKNLSPVLQKRNVHVEVLEEVFDNIDEYIVQEEFDRRKWEVFELTQSQDVTCWITDPAMIEGLDNSFIHLRETIKNMELPINILDVGCYGGYLLDFLQKRMDLPPDAFRYKGIDIQANAIEAAKAAHSGIEGAEFSVGDIFKLKENEKEGAYDVVWCSRVLIHLPNPEKCIENLIHVAKKKLLIVLKISDRSSCKKIMETDLDNGNQVVYFFRCFSEKDISTVAKTLHLHYKINYGEPYSTVIFTGKATPE